MSPHIRMHVIMQAWATALFIVLLLCLAYSDYHFPSQVSTWRMFPLTVKISCAMSFIFAYLSLKTEPCQAMGYHWATFWGLFIPALELALIPAGLELQTLLPQLPSSWNYKSVTPDSAMDCFRPQRAELQKRIMGWKLQYRPHVCPENMCVE